MLHCNLSLQCENLQPMCMAKGHSTLTFRDEAWEDPVQEAGEAAAGDAPRIRQRHGLRRRLHVAHEREVAHQLHDAPRLCLAAAVQDA